MLLIDLHQLLQQRAPLRRAPVHLASRRPFALSLRPDDLAQFLFCRRTFVLEIRGRRVGCRRIGRRLVQLHPDCFQGGSNRFIGR